MEDTFGCITEMTSKLCCALNPEMTCGFCKEEWCSTCYYALTDWPNNPCSVPNTSGSDQGNHYTMDIGSEMTNPSRVRLLQDNEKVTDFDQMKSRI